MIVTPKILGHRIGREEWRHCAEERDAPTLADAGEEVVSIFLEPEREHD
jgi:hypothetical protein